MPCRTPIRTAAALTLLAAGAAHADVVNLDTLVLKRLQDNGKLADAYQRAFGSTVPPNATITTQFVGATTGTIEYQPNRTVTPKVEVLDMARVQNCNDQPARSRVALGKKREDSFSLSNTDTVETSVSVSVSVDAPFASAKSELKQSWSSSTTTAQSKSEAVSWSREDEVTVSPGMEVLTQLALDTSNVAGTYRVPLMLKGETRMKVLAPAAPYVWKGVSGKRLPGDALGPGREAGQVLQICAVPSAYRTPAFGKVWKGGCEVAPRPELTGMIFHVVFSNYQVLTGDPRTLQWMSAADQRASGKPGYAGLGDGRFGVCLARHGDADVPGNLNGNTCQYTTGDKYRETGDYKVLMPASIAAEGTFKLEDVLNESQRAVDVRGRFNGSAGTNVTMRIGRPARIAADQCLSSESPASTVTTASAGRPPVGAVRAATVKKVPVDTNTPLIASGP